VATVALVLTMRGSNFFSILVVGLVIQTFLYARVSSAQISSTPADSKPRDNPPQDSPPRVDIDPVRSPDDKAVTEPSDVPRNDKGHFTLRRDVEEVILNATVVDSHGRTMEGLQKENFRVTEDGAVQSIADFEHQDLPISLAILVDNSGSMGAKRLAVNTAAVDLVNASNPEDETVIVNFADEAYQDTDLTSNVDELRDGLSRIGSRGGTALYDAVIVSADYLKKAATRPKQVILIITDGQDNASGNTLEETVRRIQELQGPVVYSIGLLFDDSGGGSEVRNAKRALTRLSDETGGTAYFPKKLAQVDEVAKAVAADIRSQYTIGYHSAKPVTQGGYRTVHVDAYAKGMNRLTVKTRSGYFAK
jgi:Ca-activated chloride channel homolog